MTDLAQPSPDWTEPEQWVWKRILAGEPADLNARDREQNPEFKDLDPCKEDGWAENRRLGVEFLKTILTHKDFADATPYGGVRVLGALVDDAPLVLEHARLQRLFWLDRSRILTDVKCRSLRVNGEMSLEKSFVAGDVDLSTATVQDSLTTALGRFKGEVNLVGASIGSAFSMRGSTFEKKVDLNSAKVGGGADLGGACFEGEVDLVGASIGSSLEMSGSTFEKKVSLNGAKVGGGAFLNGACFKGEVDLVSASLGTSLEMSGSTFEKKVSLNSAKVDGGAFLNGACFKGEVNLVSASLGTFLEMSGSTFEKKVSMNGAKVGGGAFLSHRACFKGEIDLVSASLGTFLEMSGSTFEKKVSLNGAKVGGGAFLNGACFKGEVDLVSASLGTSLEMSGSTFEKKVSLNSAKVDGGAFLNGACFKGEVNLVGASIGSSLQMSGSTFEGEVNLTGCQVIGELRLGSSRHRPARWKQAALLVLRNTHVGALQDWWQDSSDNSWPKVLKLEGFTFDRLGGLHGEGKEADMMARPSECYVEWLRKDSGFSPQPYEHLASLFRRAGEPGKANDILYAARERRRRLALSKVDDRGYCKDREVLEGVGLGMLRLTIGYGLGNRYFRVLWWVGGLTLLGTFVLIAAGQLSVFSGALAIPVLCEPRPVAADHHAQQSPRRAHLRGFVGPPSCRPAALLGTGLLLLARDSRLGARLVYCRRTSWPDATELSALPWIA